MYFLFDVGGTKIRFGASHDGRKIQAIRVAATPKNFNRAMELFQRVRGELCGRAHLKKAVGGVPGPFNRDRTRIVGTPNLRGWNGKPLRDALRRALRARVFLENDAALVGIGEAVYGAGKGNGIVAYITVSTGVGGARIVDGRIDRNAMGFEPGAQIVDFLRGTDLEGLVSGTAIEKRYRLKPYEITDKKVWDETARTLAYGLSNTIALWSPDIVVLGGSMMKTVGIPLARVRFYLRKILPFPHMPRLRKAVLGDFGGLYGALAYAREKEQNR